MVWDNSINIPTIIALGSIIVGLFRMHRNYLKIEFKVDELWRKHTEDN